MFSLNKFQLKNFVPLPILFFLLSFTFISCLTKDPEAEYDYTNIKEFYIDSEDELVLVKNKSVSLHVIINPTGTKSSDSIIWNETSATPHHQCLRIEAEKTNATITADDECQNGEIVTLVASTFNGKETLVTQQVKILIADQEQTLSSMEILPSNKFLSIGQSKQLKILATPPTASNKEVTWQSSNSEIVEVNNKGTITAKAKGNVIITATSKENNSIYALAHIHVTNPIAVQKITVLPQKPHVLPNKSLQLSATIEPDNATYGEIQWKSLEPSIAGINAKTGLVTAASVENAGKVTIQVTVGTKTQEVSLEVIDVTQPAKPTLSSSQTWPLQYTMLSEYAEEKGKIYHPFELSPTEVPYGRWVEVSKWASEHGYKLFNARPGSVYTSEWDGFTLTNSPYLVTKENENQPATGMNWYEAALWCNALTEYANARYAEVGINIHYTPVYKDEQGKVIRDVDILEETLKNVTDAGIFSGDGFRLPTEAEWEFAARYMGTLNENNGTCPANSAQDGNYCLLKDKYVSSSSFREYDDCEPNSPINGELICNINNLRFAVINNPYYAHTFPSGVLGAIPKKGIIFHKTADVGSKEPNYLGLYDTFGNVTEWCFDMHRISKKELQANGPNADANKWFRVTKGGSYADFLFTLLESASYDTGAVVASDPYMFRKNNANLVTNDVGLRVARTIK